MKHDASWPLLSRISLVLVAALLSLAPITGCDTGLQTDLDDARDVRFAKAEAAFKAVQTQRNALYDATVPSLETQVLEGLREWVMWRASASSSTPVQQAEGLKPVLALFKDGASASSCAERVKAIDKVLRQPPPPPAPATTEGAEPAPAAPSGPTADDTIIAAMKACRRDGGAHPALYWRQQGARTQPFPTKWGAAQGSSVGSVLGIAGGLFKGAKTPLGDGVAAALKSLDVSSEPVEKVEAEGDAGVTGTSLTRKVAVGTAAWGEKNGHSVSTELTTAASEGKLEAETAFYVWVDKKAIGWLRVHAPMMTGAALIELAQAYKGTPSQQPAIDSAAFLDKSSEYWLDPMKRSSQASYERFLRGYLLDHGKDLTAVEDATAALAAAESKLGPTQKNVTAADEALKAARDSDPDMKDPETKKLLEQLKQRRDEATTARSAHERAEERLAKAKYRKENFVSRLFLAEARFDLFFLHAAREFKYGHLASTFVQESTTFPYWQIAFELTKLSGESLSDYKSRLCLREDMAERCQTVVHEKRFLAIHKPYLEWVGKQIDGYANSDTKLAAFDTMATAYRGIVASRMKMTQDLSEDPVLPSTMSSRAAASGAQLVSLEMSKKTGVQINGMSMADTFNGSYLDATAKKVTEHINKLKAAGAGIDYSRVVFQAPGDIKASQVTKVLASLPGELVETVELVGRRRVDKSLRKTGFLLGLRREQATTTSYQFKNDDKKVSCPWWGFAGAPRTRSARYGLGHYMVVGNDNSVKVAKLSWEEVAPEPGKAAPKKEGEAAAPEKKMVVSDITMSTTADNSAKLAEWANDKKNRGYVRLFLPGSWSWDRMMQFMTGLVYDCVDTTLKMDDFSGETKTITCGKAKERRLTLVVAVCD